MDGAGKNLPGTTSLASIMSSYSMKPKPFMSLISLMVPAPWLEKCSSTSCLVTERLGKQVSQPEERQFKQDAHGPRMMSKVHEKMSNLDSGGSEHTVSW